MSAGSPRRRANGADWNTEAARAGVRSGAASARSGRRAVRALFGPALLALLAWPTAPSRAEVIETVIARINDDIITKSELADAEQQVVADIYARLTGDELERELARTKIDLLKDMITKKLLVQQAERLYDLSKMEDAFIREFKEGNKLSSTPELEKLLKNEGMTLQEFKKKLVEVNAPGSVIQYEVRDKISVSDGETEAFYKEHGGELATPERVSFREIVLLAQGRSRDETLARANALREEIRSGSDFETVAKQSSQVEASVRGGLLGPFKRGELAPELEKVAFAMKPGEISEPVEIGPSVHVVRVESREDSVAPSLESVRDKISELIERQKFQQALDAYILGLWSRSDIRVPMDEYAERLPVDYRKFLK